MEISPEIELTEDGSATLVHPLLGDRYHSTRGAIGESKHIFIDNGLRLINKKKIKILDAGFGSGLNALLTLWYAEENGLHIDYHTVELYPIDIPTAGRLGYTDKKEFMQLHKAQWGSETRITDFFTITKSETDLADGEFGDGFDLVYFDAFSPDTQPELWSEEMFRKIYGCMTEGGVLVTYSAKGDVKRALRNAGFEVHRLQGALGKRHMLKATK